MHARGPRRALARRQPREAAAKPLHRRACVKDGTSMVCFVSGRASLHGLTSQRSSQRGRRVLRRSRPPPRAGTDLHGCMVRRSIAAAAPTSTVASSRSSSPSSAASSSLEVDLPSRVSSPRILKTKTTFECERRSRVTRAHAPRRTRRPAAAGRESPSAPCLHRRPRPSVRSRCRLSKRGTGCNRQSGIK